MVQNIMYVINNDPIAKNQNKKKQTMEQSKQVYNKLPNEPHHHGKATP
jgi:glucose/arabinose dehydrogenase